MFKNVGKKIMTIAKIFTWIGIVCSILAGIGIIFGGAQAMSTIQLNGQVIQRASTVANIIVGVFVMVFGSIMSWVGSLMTYGFGYLIHCVDEIRYNSMDTSGY